MVIVQHLVDSKHSFDIDRIKLIEALVESSVDRIIVFTTAYRVIIWNRKCEEFYQLKKKDAIDRHFFNIFPTIRNDVELVDAIERAMQGKMVHLPPRKSIIRGYYESFFIPLNNEAEQAYGVLTVIHDITERIQAEEKLNELNDSLQRKNRELEAMNQELSSIAFVAGHDLSEPLRKIQVFSEAILKKEVTVCQIPGKTTLTAS
jgi:PAS domain S-box